MSAVLRRTYRSLDLKVTYVRVVKVSVIAFTVPHFYVLFKIRLLKFSASHNTAFPKMQ